MGCAGSSQPLDCALADPVDTAVLLFKADSPEVPEAFAKADPYVLNGLVTQ